MDELEEKLSEFFSGATLQFLCNQLRLVDQKQQGRRWKDSDKEFALSLYHASPKAYRILKQLFLLPSISTLRRIMRKIKIYPGFNKTILKALETKVSSMPANSELCCVIVDEMALKEAVEYNQEKDYVEGLEDFGVNGRTKYVANHATVFMARGLIFPWKQTVGYALSSGPIKYSDLHSLLLECIEKLEESGLRVKVIITDQGSNNRKMFEGCCGVNEENPFFFHNGKKIFVVYDPPHLLKNVRNNLRKHGFLVNGEEVSWEHIRHFYNFDKKNPIRVAPKLTAKHMDLPPFAALRVKYAAQVLSHSVASGIALLVSSGIFGQNALPTAHFLENFDQLFNTFNSGNLLSRQKMGHALSERSGHQEFLQSSLEWLQTVRPTSSRTATLPCLKGWKMAVRALLQLWDHLRTDCGITFLLTNRLNQDCLENLFSTIRGKGGHGDNPSAKQFRIRLSQTMVDSFFLHSHGSNCEEDHDRSLLALGTMTAASQGIDAEETEAAGAASEAEGHLEPKVLNHLCTVTTLALSPTDDCLHVQENVICYIAGFIARKMRGKVCQGCSDTLTGSERGLTSEMLIKHKQFQSSQGEGLVFPSDELASVIKLAENTYRKNIEQFLHTDKIKTRLTDLLEKNVRQHTTLECLTRTCQMLRNVIRLFTNIRLYFTLKDCSRSFSGLQRRNRKLMKVTHV